MKQDVVKVTVTDHGGEEHVFTATDEEELYPRVSYADRTFELTTRVFEPGAKTCSSEVAVLFYNPRAVLIVNEWSD